MNEISSETSKEREENSTPQKGPLTQNLQHWYLYFSQKVFEMGAPRQLN